MEIVSLEEVQAEMIMKLVREHKKNCKGDCDISLSPLLPLYEKLIGGKATHKECMEFF